jgi:hypothetical protein
MRIDSSGNVGIGTSSPAVKLDVAGGNGNFIRYTSTGGVSTILGDAGGVNGQTGTTTNHNFLFLTNAAERMRIDTNGNLLLETTTQNNFGKMTLSYNGIINNGLAITDRNNTTGTSYLVFAQGATSIGSVARVGATSAVIYNTTSDQRLKSNIVDASPVLEKLMDVKVRQFDWTEGDLHQDAGFIAQELAPVLSGIVTEGKTEEDMWQLDYSRLTPYLVKAIQEQQAIITDLKARIETLENK